MKKGDYGEKSGFIVYLIFMALTVFSGGLMLLTVMDTFTMYHENAHLKIFQYNGDVNASVSYITLLGFRISGSTTSYNYSTGNYASTKRESVMFLHSLNEVIGYHVAALIFTFSVISIWFGILLVMVW